MKKGYTLIELLVIIALIAVISVLATPIVSNLIGDAKKKTFKNSAYTIIKAAEQYQADEALKNGGKFKKYTFDLTGNELKYKGKQPLVGTLVISEKSETKLEMSDGTWCVTKKSNEKKVKISRISEDNPCTGEFTTNPSCFVYDTVRAIVSYDINYEKCMAFFEGTDVPESDQELYCKGEETSDGRSIAHDLEGDSPELDEEDWGGGVAVTSHYQTKTSTLATLQPSNKAPVGHKMLKTAEKIAPSEGAAQIYAGTAQSTGDYQWLIDEGIIENIVYGDEEIIILGYKCLPQDGDSVLVDYDIDHDACMNSISAPTEEDAETICSGGIVNDGCMDMSIDSIISRGDYQFLIDEGVIKNLVYAETSLDVVIPKRIDGTNVTMIGGFAFNNNGLTSVKIPDSVTSIEHSAFAYNQLTSVEMPSNITKIGDYAFQFNYLTNVTIPSSVTSLGNCAFANNDPDMVITNNSSQTYSCEKNNWGGGVQADTLK